MPLEKMTCSRVVCGSEDLGPAIDVEALLLAAVIVAKGVGPCLAWADVSKQWVDLHKVFDAAVRYVMDPSVYAPT
jgi:hypothetical protein